MCHSCFSRKYRARAREKGERGSEMAFICFLLSSLFLFPLRNSLLASPCLPLPLLSFDSMLESMVSPSGLARIQLAIVTGALLYTILHIILYNAGVVAHVFFSADFGTLLLYTLVPTRILSGGRVTTVLGSSSSSSSSSTIAGSNSTNSTTSAATAGGGGNMSQWVKASILRSRSYILVALSGLWAIQPYQLTDLEPPPGGDDTLLLLFFPFDLLRDSNKKLSKLARTRLNQKQNLTNREFRDLKRNAYLTALAMQGLAIGA